MRYIIIRMSITKKNKEKNKKNMSILPLPQHGQVETAKNMHQSDCYRSASAASIWLGAHIKSIVKIIFPSSKSLSFKKT